MLQSEAAKGCVLGRQRCSRALGESSVNRRKKAVKKGDELILLDTGSCSPSAGEAAEDTLSRCRLHLCFQRCSPPLLPSAPSTESGSTRQSYLCWSRSLWTFLSDSNSFVPPQAGFNPGQGTDSEGRAGGWSVETPLITWCGTFSTS